MMATLSRTTSQESGSSNQGSRADSLEGNTQYRSANMSGPPSPSDPTKPGPSLASAGRVPSSHSLLSAPTQNAVSPSRKSRFADAGTTGTNAGRASISMPPPTTKPSSIYKPASVRRPSAMQNPSGCLSGEGTLDGTVEEGPDINGLADVGGTTSFSGVQSGSTSEPHSPSALSDVANKNPNPSSNKAGDRLSFSSLYSIGSALYIGATGLASAPQSKASSNAGSVKSVVSEPSTLTPTPLSPSLGAANERDAVSIATIATNPISITANTQPLHQGSSFPWIVQVSTRVDGCG